MNKRLLALCSVGIAEAAKRPHTTVGIKLAPRTEASAPVDVMLAIGALPAGSAADAEVLVSLTPGVATKELRVVAFIQERASRHILGAATRDVETP